MITILDGDDPGVRSEVLAKLSYFTPIVPVTGRLNFESALDLVVNHGHAVFDGFLVSDELRNAASGKFTAKDKRLSESTRALERILLSKRVSRVVFCDKKSKHYELLLSRIFESSIPTLIVSNDDHRSADDIITSLNVIRSPQNLGDGIGVFRPGNVLVVGETPGKLRRNIDFPFATDVGAGFWLNRLMDSEHISEQDFYWINAIRTDGTKTDPKFIDDLKPSNIIALGNVASQWCSDNDLVHYKLPHPSYWKRFHSKEPYAFIETVKRLLG